MDVGLPLEMEFFSLSGRMVGWMSGIITIDKTKLPLVTRFQKLHSLALKLILMEVNIIVQAN